MQNAFVESFNGRLRDEFVKLSVATPIKHSKAGQFVAHVAAMPGNPYAGHTLAKVIPAMEVLIGNTIAATTPRPITSSASSPRTRSADLRPPSSAR
jgi:hypothetical protein